MEPIAPLFGLTWYACAVDVRIGEQEPPLQFSDANAAGSSTQRVDVLFCFLFCHVNGIHMTSESTLFIEIKFDWQNTFQQSAHVTALNNVPPFGFFFMPLIRIRGGQVSWNLPQLTTDRWTTPGTGCQSIAHIYTLGRLCDPNMHVFAQLSLLWCSPKLAASPLGNSFFFFFFYFNLHDSPLKKKE